MEVTHEADSFLMKMIVLLITHSSVILYAPVLTHLAEYNITEE
jgi:hypothetical protein